MDALGPYTDSPNTTTVNAGNQVSVTLEYVADTVAEICWNIPIHITGNQNAPNAYDGIVIFINTIHEYFEPHNNTYYTSDLTVDYDIHAGDRINDQLCIGAFYHDKVTNSITITGLTANTSYYVTAFVVDNVCRYYKPAIRTYSLPKALNLQGDDTSGYQVVTLGVKPMDHTQLIDELYYLPIHIDGIDHILELTRFTTFQDLCDDINFNIIKLDDPHIDTEPEFNNALVVTKDKLYKFDGSTYNECKEFIISDTAINSLPFTNYWWDDTSLYQYTDNAFNVVPLFKYHKAPNNLSCDDYWLNTSTNVVFKFNGTLWVKCVDYTQPDDPLIVIKPQCNSIWYNGGKFYKYCGCVDDCTPSTSYELVNVLQFTIQSPVMQSTYWFNSNTNKLLQNINNVWIVSTLYSQLDEPVNAVIGDVWLNTNTGTYITKTTSTTWNDIIVLDISILDDGNGGYIDIENTYWFNKHTELLYTYNNTQFTQVTYTLHDYTKSSVKTNDCWVCGDVLNVFDGVEWVQTTMIMQDHKPDIAVDTYWYNGVSFYDLHDTNNVLDITPKVIFYDVSPLMPKINQFWWNGYALKMWNGIDWIGVSFNNKLNTPTKNWYNPITKAYKQYTDGKWVDVQPKANVVIKDNNLVATSTSVGSVSTIMIHHNYSGYVSVFDHTIPQGNCHAPIKGTDGINTQPLYLQQGVGTDSTPDERRNLIHNVLLMLGYPALSIELSKDALELCVNNALSSFRKFSTSAYDRSIFFMDLMPGQQVYKLTDKSIGMHKIVRVNGAYRKASSFLGTAHGQGIYGQMVLQQLYQMGTYDLLSYHLISEYTETLEILFATRLVTQFNERTRELKILQNIGFIERICIDCSIERTEQELFTDRISGKWIQKWALAEAHQMLANIRGKFSSIPGAGGSVSLNGAEMQAKADILFDKCHKEIDEYTANEIELMGLASCMVIG
jgi:hypothetical protein